MPARAAGRALRRMARTARSCACSRHLARTGPRACRPRAEATPIDHEPVVGGLDATELQPRMFKRRRNRPRSVIPDERRIRLGVPHREGRRVASDGTRRSNWLLFSEASACRGWSARRPVGVLALSSCPQPTTSAAMHTASSPLTAPAGPKARATLALARPKDGFDRVADIIPSPPSPPHFWPKESIRKRA